MSANAHLNSYLEEDCISEFEDTFRKSMRMCLSDRLEEILKGKRIIFDSNGQTIVPLRRDRSFEPASAAIPRVIHPNEKITYITAIDSSVVHLAIQRREGCIVQNLESSCLQVEEYDAISG